MKVSIPILLLVTLFLLIPQFGLHAEEVDRHESNSEEGFLPPVQHWMESNGLPNEWPFEKGGNRALRAHPLKRSAFFPLHSAHERLNHETDFVPDYSLAPDPLCRIPGNMRIAWVSHYSSGLLPSNDVATALKVDRFGYSYVTGYISNPPHGMDFFTLKYSPSGEQLWTAQYNGDGNEDDFARAIHVDQTGNVYVAGTSWGGDSGDDYATVKYNSKGVQQWVARYNGPENSLDEVSTLIVDDTGNVYVTGKTATVKYNEYGKQEWVDRCTGDAIVIDHAGNICVTGKNDYYITVKYGADGARKWMAHFNGPGHGDDVATAMTTDHSANVYITGYSYDSITSNDFTTVKYNSRGVKQWTVCYNGTGNLSDKATAMAVDDSGNVYVTGSSVGSRTGNDFGTIKYTSQGVQKWVARYNGPRNFWDEATAITVDDAGNIYVTGKSLGPETSFDYATIKYNEHGTQQWVSRYSGPGNQLDYAIDIAVDGFGNLYVTGYTKNTDSVYDYLTVKYNSAGEEQWVDHYNGPGNFLDYATALGVDGSGNVYVTGYGKGVGTWDDYYTIKYNSSGDRQWVTRYHGRGNHEDRAFAMAVDESGNVYVTGGSCGPGTLYDFATVKYDRDGFQQWVACYNGPGVSEDAATAIAIDDFGNVYVTGYSGDSEIGHDYVTIKYSSDGHQEWEACYSGLGNGSDIPTAIRVDDAGNVYLTGSSEAPGTFFDYATIKYDSRGILEWVSTYKGPGVSDDRPCDLVVDSGGNVFVTGNTATLKYSSEGVEEWFTSNGGTAIAVDESDNVYLAGRSRGSGWAMYITTKYVPPSVSVTAPDETRDPTGYRLSQNYPNPFNITTTIQFTLPHGERRTENGRQNPIPTSLKIYNLLGQEVRMLVDEPKEAGYYSVTWDGRDSFGQEVASGLYVYQLQVGSFSEAKKLILLK